MYRSFIEASICIYVLEYRLVGQKMQFCPPKAVSLTSVDLQKWKDSSE